MDRRSSFDGPITTKTRVVCASHDDASVLLPLDEPVRDVVLGAFGGIAHATHVVILKVTDQYLPFFEPPKELQLTRAVRALISATDNQLTAYIAPGVVTRRSSSKLDGPIAGTVRVVWAFGSGGSWHLHLDETVGEVVSIALRRHALSAHIVI